MLCLAEHDILQLPYFILFIQNWITTARRNGINAVDLKVGSTVLSICWRPRGITCHSPAQTIHSYLTASRSANSVPPTVFILEGFVCHIYCSNISFISIDQEIFPAGSDFWHSGSSIQKVSSTMMKLESNVIMEEWTPNLSNNDGDIGDHEWQALPIELLMHILSFGDDRTVIIASGVCTGWRDAICIGVNKISLSWCKRNMVKLVQSVAPKFTHLQSLNLRQSHTQLNDQAVEMVAKHCPDLFDLDLSNSTKLTDVSLSALARGCAQLENLNISGCSGVTDSAIIFLTEKCKRLRNLNLCGCASAGTDRTLLALAQNCRGLQSLNLGWCEQVTDIGVTSLAFWCPELLAVDLCGCVLITDRSVVALAENCLCLRSLGLYYCQNITDVAMHSLANSSTYRAMKAQAKCNGGDGRCMSELACLDGPSWSDKSNRSSMRSVRSCSGCGSKAISSHNYLNSILNDRQGYGLINLNISQCTALSAPAVQAVCDAFPSLHTCLERHSLIISGCLNLTSVHCVCAAEAQRERRNRALSVWSLDAEGRS